jgi:HEAT repeat protein
MRARSKIIVASCAVGACACLLFGLVWFRSFGNSLADSPEPTYKGRPLRFWVTELTRHGEFDLNPPDQAATAIREVGPAAVPLLIKWLPKPERNPEPPVNSEAIIAAFRALGPKARSALPTFSEILTTKRFSMRGYETWHTVSESVAWIGPEAIPVMLTAVTNLQGVHERWELIKQLGILESNGAPAIPALIAWAHDKDGWVRDGAVSALGEIGQEPEVVLPVLKAAASSDPDHMVRRDAAEALGSFGTRAMPDLIRANSDPDWYVRTGVMGGLGKLALEKPDVVLPLLDQGLHDDTWIVRRSAAYALGFSGSKAAYNKLMAATNVAQIGDIIYQIRTTVSPEKLK